MGERKTSVSSKRILFVFERKGVALIKAVVKGQKNEASLPKRILEAEMYLNDQVATEIDRRFALALRVHF